LPHRSKASCANASMVTALTNVINDFPVFEPPQKNVSRVTAITNPAGARREPAGQRVNGVRLGAAPRCQAMDPIKLPLY